MKACDRCDGQRTLAITLDDTIDAGGHTFMAQLPAEKCEVCGQIVIQGQDLKLFELRVAVELAKAGIREKDVFEFLRKAISLEAGGPAHILDMPEEFIGDWGTGGWPVDPPGDAGRCSLVLAKLTHRPAT